MRISRQTVAFGLLALVTAFVITRLIPRPGYTDAYYHFNAANRLASGQGLTEDYVWMYLGAYPSLPAPSHLYWMPLTSLVTAVGMRLLNAPGNYAAAQWPLALLLAGTACIGYGLGRKLGKSNRHAWGAGLLTLFSGYFTRFWGATDTFAPYAFCGALCLLALGMGVEQISQNARRAFAWFALAGAMAALGHLARADGLLLVMVGWVVILWPGRWWSIPLLTPPPDPLPIHGEGEKKNTPPQVPLPAGVGEGFRVRGGLSRRLIALAILTLAYLLVMTPWFVRNIKVAGTAFPTSGTQAAWLTEYNDLFDYPPDATPQRFFANGLGLLVSSRWLALTNNLGTLFAVEGLIVMTPLMLVGLWRRRRDGFLRGFWVYALGMHLAMTFVFPFPGYRGGVFHSAAALVPWWAALGMVGLDDAIEWIARRRRRWRAQTAKAFFSAALVVYAIVLSAALGLSGRVTADTPALYTELAQKLPPAARVMVNDPAALYYFTGHGGVPLPNNPPEVIPEIARKYGISYVLLESRNATPIPLWPLFDSPPAGWTLVPLDTPDVRLYAIPP